MLIEALLLHGICHVTAFLFENVVVCITIYCQKGERSTTYYCQETVGCC